MTKKKIIELDVDSIGNQENPPSNADFEAISAFIRKQKESKGKKRRKKASVN
jgi:hypothetical protein